MRDFIHIDDLFEALKIQIEKFDKYNGEIYNIGGGYENSLSLKEMTKLCEKITENKIKIESITENRPNDLKFFVTDSSKFKNKSSWKCKKNPEETFQDIYDWIKENEEDLRRILNQT